MQRRQGFTLVELLVAMALTLFIMAILPTAFTTGLDTFRGLKGIGDMQQGLRTASHRLQVDLQAHHFEGDRKLSDLNSSLTTVTGPITQGFFKIEQVNTSTPEGEDLDGMTSSRAVNHYLHFTINLRGSRPQDFLTASLPPSSQLLNNNNQITLRFKQPDIPDARFQDGNFFSSQWAEIAYFLGPKIGTTTDATNPNETKGTPLYGLYRVQRVVVPQDKDIDGIIPNGALSQYGEFSCVPDASGKLDFNTPSQLARYPLPTNTRSFDYASYKANPGFGSSLLLTNVVSFEIQIREITGGFNNIDPTTHPNNKRVFDTALSPEYALSAVRITLRVWDPNTDQTRQVTIIQDL